ncbi:MAG: endonuclease [Dehalococcoidales bacterium]|nr:endonuclease [Dehalococcoidales bacterium]
MQRSGVRIPLSPPRTHVYQMHYVYIYILKSDQTGRHYSGSSSDVQIKLHQHNAGKTLSTKSYIPWRLIHTEGHNTRQEARQRERQIKSWKNPAYMLKALGLND